MNKTLKAFLLFLFLSVIMNATLLFAQWSSDPTVNNPICTASYNQSSPAIVSDGAGGAIITFEYKHSSGTNPDIFAQCIDSNGIIKWVIDGVPISEAANSQLLPTITSDGVGGAIITWFDGRNGAQSPDIYAQRIDSNGVVQWTTDGVAICTAAYGQYNPQIVSDGAGGAIITWTDSRSSSSDDIYAQHINQDGVVQWMTDGIAVCTAVYDQSYPAIIIDGVGGAIISWFDKRIQSNNAIYSQHIDPSGILQWASNGIVITQSGGYPVMISDGSGGAIITYSNAGNIFAQKVDVFGLIQWASNGIQICTAANNQLGPVLTNDGAGGAIITWQDFRNSNYDIYSQRVNADGIVQWATDGVDISLAAAYQQGPKIVNDNIGGAIITWYDYRNGNTTDIYAQRIDGSGVVQWLADGVAVSTAAYSQSEPAIIGNSSNGSIITWEDYRSGGEYDIYAQLVNADGTLGTITFVKKDETVPKGFVLEQNYPNPFNPSTTINYSIPNEEFISLKIFNSLGEEVAELLNETKPAGNYSFTFNASTLTSGVYFYKISAGNFVETKKMMLIK